MWVKTYGYLSTMMSKMHTALIWLQWQCMCIMILRSQQICPCYSLFTKSVIKMHTIWSIIQTHGTWLLLCVYFSHHSAGSCFPVIKDIYTKLCMRKNCIIGKDFSHPSHEMTTFLPSGRRLRLILSNYTGFISSHILQLIRPLNKCAWWIFHYIWLHSGYSNHYTQSFYKRHNIVQMFLLLLRTINILYINSTLVSKCQDIVYLLMYNLLYSVLPKCLSLC